MVSFEIAYPKTKAGKNEWNRRFGLNAYYSGKHYHQRKRDANDIHAITWAALRRAKIDKRPVKLPVEIRFYWDDTLDIDNHAILGKMIVDGMKGWTIFDDSPKWVKKISHEFWDKGCIGVEICTIEDVSAKWAVQNCVCQSGAAERKHNG